MIDWNEIDTKGKTSGQFKTKCPACIDRRTNKKDKSLSVNLSKGLANCHYCGEFSIRDVEESTKKDYKLPSQNWRNYTELSERMVKYFEKRGISQSTIINNRITEEEYYQPQMEKKTNNIVFNYFEGETLVNKKYRSAKKHFTQSAGTKNIFYGINDIIGQEEVFIVEGEFDKLALYEVGYKNAISVPNGANDNDDVWSNSQKYLDGVKMFYIAVDCDEKGDSLSEKIAQRLGRWRCQRIVFDGKDANDDLIDGKETLLSSLKNPVKYPVSGTFGVSDLYEKIVQLHDEGLPPTIYPKNPCFGSLHEVFSTMRGHLCVVTGIPSHGKSSFTEWYVLNLVNEKDMKASFFSPEHSPMEYHQSTFIEKTMGKNFWKDLGGVPRISKDEILEYTEWANEKIYLTSPEDGNFATWDWLFDKFKEQMFNYGVDIFVIDAFNKIEFNDKANDLQNIRKVLTKLTMFSQMNNVIVFLVAHPTKMKKNDGIYDIPTLYDVSGSADFRNQTHDGFCIYRYFEDEYGEPGFNSFINLKTKKNFQGKIGESVDFDYDKISGRFYAKGTKLDRTPIYYSSHMFENGEIQNLTLMEPSDVWDEEIPF